MVLNLLNLIYQPIYPIYMKSVYPYIHFLWMFIFTSAASQEQKIASDYSTSLSAALAKAEGVLTLSAYYTKGLIFDTKTGKKVEDAPIEALALLTNLKECKLNGYPAGFRQEVFFESLAQLEQLEVIEIRMPLHCFGSKLTDKSIHYLKNMKSLRRLNLPHQYPWQDLDKLQAFLPNCEIIINLYTEGE